MYTVKNEAYQLKIQYADSEFFLGKQTKGKISGKHAKQTT